MLTRNTYKEYGWVSKLLHWIIAILVLFQVFTAFWTILFLPEGSPLAGVLIGQLHKPLGVITGILVLFNLFWYLNNIRPMFPLTMPLWEKITARIVHFLLLCGVLLMSVSGLIFTTAGGRPPNLFGVYQIPQFMAENKEISEVFFRIHVMTAFIVIGLVMLHTLAALKHHFIDRDNILKRML